jgi:phosphopantetheine adenylyltransferase
MASTATASTRLIVGLSGPAMLKDKEHAEYMETWEMRASRTLEFLRGIVDLTPYDCRAPLATTSVDGGLVATFTEWREEEAGAAAAPPRTLTVFVSELSDPFGPTITDESITAIVVTKETESGGAAVNRRREEKGWAPLEVGVVDLLMDGEKKLSSSELRRRAGEQKGAGEVNSAA